MVCGTVTAGVELNPEELKGATTGSGSLEMVAGLEITGGSSGANGGNGVDGISKLPNASAIDCLTGAGAIATKLWSGAGRLPCGNGKCFLLKQYMFIFTFIFNKIIR